MIYDYWELPNDEVKQIALNNVIEVTNISGIFEEDLAKSYQAYKDFIENELLGQDPDLTMTELAKVLKQKYTEEYMDDWPWSGTSFDNAFFEYLRNFLKKPNLQNFKELMFINYQEIWGGEYEFYADPENLFDESSNYWFTIKGQLVDV